MRFNQIHQPSILDEVSMSPASLQKWAAGSDTEGMLMGIEFEMCVPNTAPQEKNRILFNKDYNTPVSSIEDILKFLEKHDNGENNILSLSEQLEDDYDEFVGTAIAFKVNKFVRENWAQFNENVRANMFAHYWPEWEAEVKNGADVDETKDNLEQWIRGEEENRSNLYRRFMDGEQEKMADNIRDSVERYNMTEHNWLLSENISDISDIFYYGFAKTYNIKIPESVSITLKGLAQLSEELKTVVGGDVKYSAEYHDDDLERTGGHWIVEQDGSIRIAKRYDAGLEIVSPPQTIAKTLQDLQKLWNWAHNQGCYTNQSTGLHMNISVPGFSIKRLDYVKLAIFSGDRYILEQFQRTANDYCNSATKIIQRNINNTSIDDSKILLSKIKSNLDTAAKNYIHDGLTEKRTSINTKDGRVEFRGPGDDYLNMDMSKIANTALRLAMALKIACDPDAHRQEYAKKLYKLISPRVEDPDINRTMKLFSLYSSGELTQAQLVQALKAWQERRDAISKDKKTDETNKLFRSGDTLALTELLFPKNHAVANQIGYWYLWRQSEPGKQHLWSNTTPTKIYNELVSRFGNNSVNTSDYRLTFTDR